MRAITSARLPVVAAAAPRRAPGARPLRAAPRPSLVGRTQASASGVGKYLSEAASQIFHPQTDSEWEGASTRPWNAPPLFRPPHGRASWGRQQSFRCWKTFESASCSRGFLLSPYLSRILQLAPDGTPASRCMLDSKQPSRAGATAVRQLPPHRPRPSPTPPACPTPRRAVGDRVPVFFWQDRAS